MVELQNLGKNVWNLAFGDLLPDDDFDDAVVSNNNDIPKVIGTVVYATLLFFQTHRGALVYIEPVDDRRKKLYNFIFQKYIAEFLPFFQIFGKSSNGWVEYDPAQFFDVISVKLR